MKLKLFLMTLLTGLLFLSANVNAAFVDVTLNPKVNEGTLNLSGALGPLKVKFEGDSIVDQVWFSNDQSGDLHDQNPTTIGSAIEHQFGVTGLSSLEDGSLNGSHGDIYTITPFTYLAIHFGRHELFFKFLTAIDEFEITVNGKAAGLSNYRTFDAPNPVPVPAAVWLFGSALASLGVFKRRKAG
jgi:hypothetical protein